MEYLIQNIAERLQLPLPGADAHNGMTHQGRFANPPIPDKHRKASVMILLYQKGEDWYTVLMRRTSKYGNDKHKGQVSFPGGQAEPSDPSRSVTATRETEEEIGIPAKNIQVLGELTQLYIPVSGFLVHPFIGYFEGVPEFEPETDEVEELIECPLNTLLEPKNRKTTQMEFSNGFVLKDVPYFDVNGNVVWGATSMIINEFLVVLEESGYLMPS